MRNERSLWIWIAVFATLLFMELPGTHLFDPDEARYAEIPREMIATHDFVTPRLNASNYFEKPPLLYWANAAAMKVFGENPLAARLPTRLAALLVAAFLILFLGGRENPPLGLMAALMYLSAPLSFVLGRINLTDGLLTATLTLTFFSLRGLFTAFENNQSTWKWHVGVGVGAALSMLTKGLIGVVLPGLVAFLWLALLGRWKDMLKVIFSPALIIFLMITAPWFVLVEKANAGFARFFFIHEHFQRYSTAVHRRNEPFYFFIGVFIAGFLPWLPELFRRCKTLLTHIRVNLFEQRDPLFFGLWAAVIVGFFSASHSKLIPYILPAMPAVAALAAHHLTPDHIRTVSMKLRLGALAALYLAAIIAAPSIARERSSYYMAVIAKNAGADTVILYKTYFQNFPWVLKRPVPVVDFQGELASDNEKDPDLFWTRERFYAEWNSGKKMVVAVRTGDAADLQSQSTVKTVELARNHLGILLANFEAKM